MESACWLDKQTLTGITVFLEITMSRIAPTHKEHKNSLSSVISEFLNIYSKTLEMCIDVKTICLS